MSEWSLIFDGFDPDQEKLREALCVLGNGYIATRGAAARKRRRRLALSRHLSRRRLQPPDHRDRRPHDRERGSGQPAELAAAADPDRRRRLVRSAQGGDPGLSPGAGSQERRPASLDALPGRQGPGDADRSAPPGAHGRSASGRAGDADRGGELVRDGSRSAPASTAAWSMAASPAIRPSATGIRAARHRAPERRRDPARGAHQPVAHRNRRSGAHSCLSERRAARCRPSRSSTPRT